MFNLMRAFLATVAMSCCITGSASAQCPGSWTLIPEGDVGIRYDGAMVFDTVRHQLIYFGGYDGVTFRNSTLTFDTLNPAAGWTDVTPEPSPGRRLYHHMVYDAARDRVVMFGGVDYDAVAFSNETWEYDPGANSWQLVATANSPAPRGLFAIAYDSARAVTVLQGGWVEFGGGNVGFADTWEYDGTDWTLRSTSGPSSRGFNAMAYDAARGECVMFGGWHFPDGGAGFLQDTWRWNGTTWTQSHPVGTIPERAAWHMLSYDSLRQVVVLATNYIGSNPHHTYEWDGAQWKSAAVGGLAPDRYASQMAFDSTRNVLVLLGGYYNNGMDLFYGDMWEWTGGNSAEPVNFITQPQDAFTCYGGSASFSVSVTGLGPFTYQWRYDGVALSGETAPMLNINNAGPGFGKGWSCAVTNGCGTELSIEAHLTVGLEADINHDNLVNTLDLTGLLGHFGQSVAPNTLGDLDNSGFVDTLDLVLLLGGFGQVCE